MAYTYSIRTWDTYKQRYTPQRGLGMKSSGLKLWQLREAIRRLRGMGYTCHRFRDPGGDHTSNDYAVLVERSDQKTDGTR